MHNLNIQLPDPLYAELVQDAATNGQSVETIVLDRIRANSTDDLPADFWTPELLASLDAAAAEADQGGSLTLDEVRDRRIAKSEAWQEAHAA